MSKKAKFRFYEELNDFLPKEKKKIEFDYSFTDHPAIKDAIEAIGVPHTEVDVILVNNQSVVFSYQLQYGDSVSVYPTFESFDVTDVTHLRSKPLREIKFVVDVHLGKLAKYLRILGFDTVYKNNYSAAEILKMARLQKRIILTRSVNILKNKSVEHGYWIRSLELVEQLAEIFFRFNLFKNARPFSRCIVCNSEIKPISKDSVIDKLPPNTKQFYNDFYQCQLCNKIYWKGSHYQRMVIFLEQLKKLKILNIN